MAKNRKAGLDWGTGHLAQKNLDGSCSHRGFADLSCHAQKPVHIRLKGKDTEAAMLRKWILGASVCAKL